MLRIDLKDIAIDDLLNTRQISPRAANCCRAAGFKNLYDIMMFYDKRKTFHSKIIRHTGAGTYWDGGDKTCTEMDGLCHKTLAELDVEIQYHRNREILEVLDGLSDKERSLLFALSHLIVEMGEYANLFMFEYYDKYNHMPMFRILEHKLQKMDTKETFVLKKTFNIFKNQKPIPVHDLAVQEGMNKKRVLALRHYFIDIQIKDSDISDGKKYYFRKFKPGQVFRLLKMQIDADWDCYISTFSGCNSVWKESPLFKDMLNKEQTAISPQFALQILSYICEDTHSIFGDFGLNRKKSKWKSIGMIKNSLVDVFDFEKFVEEFAFLFVNNTIEHSLDIENYISNVQFWFKNAPEKLSAITEIAKEIMRYEFGLQPQADGSVIVPPNKKRHPTSVLYEVLKTNGNPMHISDIFREFKKIMPNHRYTQASQLRVYLQKHKDFGYRKRSGIYTLREWKHIKTGTIRDTIIEFLNKKDVPQSAPQIMKYVLSHFPETNHSSVITSMFNDGRKRFCAFENKRYGLTEKTYPPEYRTIERPKVVKKTFEQRISELRRFLAEYGRFPFSNSKTRDERLLYRWWRQDLNSGMVVLTDAQKAEIERLKHEYANYKVGVRNCEWDAKYSEVKTILLEQQRLPFTVGEEKPLYTWAARTKKNFHENTLTDDQRQKYLELVELMTAIGKTKSKSNNQDPLFDNLI